MSSRGWSGHPPETPEEGRARLMDAAVRCLQRYGIEKTAVSDIASEAGVTKPTIYAYFDNRDQLLRSALLRAASDLGQRLIAHGKQFTEPADQIVEVVILGLHEIPNEPSLAITSRSDVPGFGMRTAFRDESLALIRTLLSELFHDRPAILADLDEIGEVVARWMLSLLVIEGPEPRSDDELRALLHRRMVPVLGLDAPA